MREYPQCRSPDFGQYQGGHFSITPTVPFSVKQNYLPSSNVRLTFLERRIYLSQNILLTGASNEVRSHSCHLSVFNHSPMSLQVLK